jgi:hypothetical protein
LLKFIFWFLLCVNAVLFAYGRGYLGNVKGSEREPARMKNQVNTDKLKLVPAAQAAAPRQAIAPAPAPAGPALIACTEIGDFAAPDARRFETRAATLELGARQSRQDVAATEITSHIVYIPPLGSKEAAERKAAELKNLGITNYFIMSDNSAMRWGISLGVFKSENAAKTLLAALNRQGVQSARVSGRATQTTKVAYRFRDLDPATREKLDAIAAGFPAQQLRSCKG